MACTATREHDTSHFNPSLVRGYTPDPDKATVAPICRHFWHIETANGPTSKGVCKKCGEVKEFANDFEGRYSPAVAPKTALADGYGWLE